MQQIVVREVLSGKVRIEAGNVLLSFSLSSDGGRIRLTGKSVDARVYDPDALGVPPLAYRAAWIRAAVILRDQRRRTTESPGRDKRQAKPGLRHHQLPLFR